ncbi:XIAP-associated factor 1 [Anolis sagrei]|uniref:XIAP-associated factor 1 n=1 Tax=Anolis sagrei TaxID=38937 RepID=UPI00352110AB
MAKAEEDSSQNWNYWGNPNHRFRFFLAAEPGGSEMKAKGGGAPPKSAMEGKEEEGGEEGATRACKNCGREVSAPNLALHEAHCLRFLSVCPECEETVALRDMEGHLARAHSQVRCPLCHQAMQQFRMEHHQAEQCTERPSTCAFCNLGLPFRRLEAHQEACGSRTERCWDCGQYVLLRALDRHGWECPGSGGQRAEAKTVLCPQCHRRIPKEEHLQHLDQCCPLPRLLGSLSTEEAVVRPKKKEKEPPSRLGRPSFKPPKSRRAHGSLAFTPTVQSPLEAEDVEDAYDHLASCSRCNILLPGPTLRKHQRKCQGQALRRSPRFLGKEEVPSPSEEKSLQ